MLACKTNGTFQSDSNIIYFHTESDLLREGNKGLVQTSEYFAQLIKAVLGNEMNNHVHMVNVMTKAINEIYEISSKCQAGSVQIAKNCSNVLNAELKAMFKEIVGYPTSPGDKIMDVQTCRLIINDQIV